MKLSELKTHVYECWKDLSDFNSSIIQPENFKPEVRCFGDLRRRRTWEKAYCAFWARNIGDCGVTNRDLITIMFNFSPDRWDYPLRNEIFAAFLEQPDALDRLRNGLEQIFGNPVNNEEGEAVNGFFDLVRTTTGREFRGNTTESFRRLVNAS